MQTEFFRMLRFSSCFSFLSFRIGKRRILEINSCNSLNDFKFQSNAITIYLRRLHKNFHATVTLTSNFQCRLLIGNIKHQLRPTSNNAIFISCFTLTHTQKKLTIQNYQIKENNLLFQIPKTIFFKEVLDFLNFF